MAPTISRWVSTTGTDVTGLIESSLELDKRNAEGIEQMLHIQDVTVASTLSPLEAHHLLTARDATSTFIPGQGAKPPGSFNNSFFFALFAILGAAMVLASLWFFFWAKNGGFHFRQGDWDDYKSTVLRRKGPDGKTLSNATKSTKLGYGASTFAGTQHYKWQKHVARSVVGRDEKGRKGVLGKRGPMGTHSITYSDDYMTESFATQTVSDMTELRTEPDYNQHSKRYRDRDVQQYKKEKPARVGGLNRVADGSHFGTTIAGSETMSEASAEPLVAKERDRAKEKERAERKAKEEAAKMERRWKKEAEEAAAALARENAASRPPPPPAHSPKRSAPPSSKPSADKQRRSSRSNSPQKRDFSYQGGAASEILSTAYTSTSGTRSASYYEEYRPLASDNPRYSTERAERAERAERSRQSSPKKGAGRKAREGGYRRGADSDLD
ncbi:hypothetical protein BAUCODRAFT_222987 [Baudoinia panamericana UAMH 10762]|uniref:Uncharacterized protein n=1 Tax=Baudoinia panamericana (strain UAMH 10762) TaxID=717646 RepID=M2MRQ7_BAUPA|nr:uncharacterized protein BAUCODRAFT_222987 [Baudoinia panamericana UAMH 10762]EMC94173.1 hypothetical protein BAUCODRAFT_222987 [Baudoinia panamericana UAMH 10762]